MAPSSPPATGPPARRSKTAQARKKKEPTASIPPSHCLALQDSQYRIALPQRGVIVLGRFDLEVKAMPDVDLSHKDEEDCVISRLHARIIARNDWHEIEDLNSTNGVQVNGDRIERGQRVKLQPGDTVTLGYCKFVYAPIPKVQDESLQAYLRATFTGRRFPLPTRGEVVIGRADRAVNIPPDIDLSTEGHVAQGLTRKFNQYRDNN